MVPRERCLRTSICHYRSGHEFTTDLQRPWKDQVQHKMLILIIISILLYFNGRNYPLWEFHFHIFIKGNELLNVLDGSLKELIDDKEKAKWRVNNVYQFTLALNDEFESVRSSLLHRDPFPKLEIMFIELLSEEARLAPLKS
ncbi:hypothetical protein P3X46_018074 [Hevea brasiliensis]|uniref:Uncharacterized protein n=1 Tax=Hevea brasiliensis TaxID=3981 RepID=A0ABQ9LRR4_HEVBR|nr:hypothetical protein P3X46_018074 [Hevea brasiliensis]